ncbi:hypothetical protein ABXT08_06995 [Chryseobacterium sp. NRRL B-14859]|uniref:hypothetical protein n=1 Tax=Chryseobacterium sp. NRRL B-14859 TaxID=1562763 RepID=UPI00339477F1
MKTPKKILQHPQYHSNDYAALKFKGYTNNEILTIWNTEIGRDKVTINKYTVDWKKVRQQIEA